MPFSTVDLIFCLAGVIAACPLALIIYALRPHQAETRAEVIDLDAARRARRLAEAPAAAATVRAF
jgi:hypothetical protein